MSLLEEIARGENVGLEFKEVRPKDSLKFTKTVVAFANGRGGRILFGVENGSGRIVGIPRAKVASEMDAIIDAIENVCAPAVSVEQGGVFPQIAGDGVNDGLSDGVNDGVSDGVNARGASGEDLLRTAIASHPGRRIRQLALLVGKSAPTVERYARSLRRRGLIEFRGAPKTGGYYQVTKK